MNKNLKLSTSTSLQSITSQALRAAALSIADRKKENEKPKKNKKKSKTRTLSEIEQSMLAIKKAVGVRTPKDLIAVYEAPGKFSTAYNMLSLYKRDEYERYINTPQTDKKGKKPQEVLKYVFYPSILNPKALGSIAVYGRAVEVYYDRLIECRHIFGIAYKGIKVEMGRRLYLDVKIRA